MIKIISIFLVTLLLFGCFESSTSSNKSSKKFDSFVSDMDGQSLKEIETELDGLITQFDKFYKLFDGDSIFSNEIEKISIADEQYEPVFETDLSSIDKILAKYKRIEFEQEYSDNKSQLSFSFKDEGKSRSFSKSTRGPKPHLSFRLNKIIYDDGSTKLGSNKDRYIKNLESLVEVDTLKQIKTIHANLKLKYTKSFDMVTVSSKEPKVKYKDGDVSLEKIKNNYVYITKSDSLPPFLKIEVLNKEGKVLGQSGSKSGDSSPKNTQKDLKLMLSALKTIKKKLKNKSFKNTQELQEYLKSKAGSFSFFHGDGFYHKEIYSYGTAHSVRVYFTKETIIKEVEFTANNASIFTDVMLMTKGDESAIINNQGEILFTVKGSDYSSVNSRYYKKYDGDYDDIFYFLNTTSKKMERLTYYDVRPLSNGLVRVEAKEDDKYSLYDLNHNPVSKNKYHYLYDYSRVVIGQTDDYLCVINKEGKETRLNGIERVYDSSENIFSVKNDKGKYGFINTLGKVVVPMIYSNVTKFSDGLSIVTNKSDMHGYISGDGKVVVPPKYKYAKEFKNGIAKVTDTEGLYGYIDKTGKEIIPTIYLKVSPMYYELIRVKSKEGLFGFLDKTGNIVIPIVYEDAISFNSGFTMVKGVGDTYKLIDTRGETILETHTTNVKVIRGMGDKRTYEFSGKKYNASGKLITN